MTNRIINKNMITIKIVKNFLTKITIDSFTMSSKINQIKFNNLMMKNPFRQLISLPNCQM